MQRESLGELTKLVIRFRDARDWKQFHRPKDMAISLALEASELLELMQWKNGPELDSHLRQNSIRVGEELADVLYWVLLISHDLGIDLPRAFRKKMTLNARKYPISKARGTHRKYSEL